MLPSQNAVTASNRLARWLEWCALTVVVLVALAAIYEAFLADPQKTGQGMFSQFQQRATMLGNETDPLKRDSMCIPLSAFGRSVDAQIPTNARVFLAGMLGPENAGGLGYFYFLSNYLFPREVAISLGQPPVYNLAGVPQGRNPASLDELTQAGYDLVLQLTPDGRIESRALKPLQPSQIKPEPISSGDEAVAFFLPLAVALAGTRMVRLLFKELENVLSSGELLASGLAIGAFFLTQSILALRMAGARMEHIMGLGVMLWAVVELVLLFRRQHAQMLQFKFSIRQIWWLLLIPAGLMLWCLFRLAGKEGLLEFDAIAFWAFKAKFFYYCAGPELLNWLKNPTLSYAHMDYPLLATLLHSFTYGVVGHVDEFVTKFWNQWMLLFLGWAILGAGKFPNQKPWLVAAVATAVILLPMTLEFTRKEGGTIPMVFFTVLSSLQLAIGMAEKQPGRIRLGLLLLMATAMVKFEGIVLLGFWGILLLLDKDSRTVFWPLRRIGLAGLLGLAGWMPYIVLRLHGTAPNAESAWMGQLIKDPGTVLGILPMHFLAFLSRRFLNNDFAAWGAPDNQHAVWQGKWTGLESLADQATLGLGWACLLLVGLAWLRGGKLCWTVLRLFLVFLGFTLFICIVWSSARSNPLNYSSSLAGSESITGGRYLYPALMSWFVAGFVFLVRVAPDKPVLPPEEKPRSSNPGRRAH
ncbi:MAG: hypothetical protein PHY43_14720 [Verrucomicrobiales bacterium]|nr:hypothetical protein [Verrucomicrobiales bacterium]